jgi:hypothetical protein
MKTEPGTVGRSAGREHSLAAANLGHGRAGARAREDRERRAAGAARSIRIEHAAGHGSPEPADDKSTDDKRGKRRGSADGAGHLPDPPRGHRTDHARISNGRFPPSSGDGAREARWHEHTCGLAIFDVAWLEGDRTSGALIGGRTPISDRNR